MEYIIGVPDGRSGEFTRAMSAIGLAVDPLRDLVRADGESGLLTRGSELGEIAWEINQFLAMLNIDEPRVPQFDEGWSPERASRLMDLAADSFQWDGNRITRNLWDPNQQGWDQIAERYDAVFGEDQNAGGGG